MGIPNKRLVKIESKVMDVFDKDNAVQEVLGLRIKGNVVTKDLFE